MRVKHTMPSVAIDPASAPIDVARTIRLQGFAPNESVCLTTTLQHDDGTSWRSETIFTADSNGGVDLTRDAPLAGEYEGVSPMGVLWSMRQTAAPPVPLPNVQPLTVHLEARGASGASVCGSFEQHFLAPGVTRREIRARGLVGTLFTPPDPGPHPVVIMLAGSGGGIMEARAALFAAHGYTTFALGYFGAPGLPAYISGTPLEYFEAGLDWAHKTLAPAHGLLAVCGVSRGGELALLLGATFPEAIGAVIAYVPSPFTHGVLNAGQPSEDRHAPTWTHRGRPLPVLSRPNTTADWSLFDDAPPPKRQTPAFLSALRDADAVAHAFIPLERIGGPVLLISGYDDALWPSTTFSELAVERLQKARHPYPVRHLAYENAGHSIQFPYVPTTVLARAHAVSGVPLVYGGTAAGNAHANEHSWPRVLDFLAAACEARRLSAHRVSA
jgi:dienelactone hydrolase